MEVLTSFSLYKDLLIGDMAWFERFKKKIVMSFIWIELWTCFMHFTIRDVRICSFCSLLVFDSKWNYGMALWNFFLCDFKEVCWIILGRGTFYAVDWLLSVMFDSDNFAGDLWSIHFLLIRNYDKLRFLGYKMGSRFFWIFCDSVKQYFVISIYGTLPNFGF